MVRLHQWNLPNGILVLFSSDNFSIDPFASHTTVPCTDVLLRPPSRVRTMVSSGPKSLGVFFLNLFSLFCFSVPCGVSFSSRCKWWICTGHSARYALFVESSSLPRLPNVQAPCPDIPSIVPLHWHTTISYSSTDKLSSENEPPHSPFRCRTHPVALHILSDFFCTRVISFNFS